MTEAAPFQEAVDSSTYFPGMEFEKILSRLGVLLQKQHCFAVLTGEEGVGKTMLCMRLAMEENLYDTILFPETVEAFGDVVGYIAYCLEIPTEGRDIKELIGDSIAELNKSERPLLIIFDQAENIYLATLERIRKLIHVFQDSGCPVHALFSGRTAFGENYEQLTAIDFEEKRAEFFTLGTMSAEESAGYIYSVIEKTPSLGERGHLVFTEEVVARICQASGGNFREINRLARETLENKKTDVSFVETLESTDKEIERRERLLNRPAGTVLSEWVEALAGFGQRLLNDKKILGLLGGGVVAALFMVWFLSSPEEQGGVDGGFQNDTVQTTENQRESAAPAGDAAETGENAAPALGDSFTPEVSGTNEAGGAERGAAGDSATGQDLPALPPLPSIGAGSAGGNPAAAGEETGTEESAAQNSAESSHTVDEEEGGGQVAFIKARPSKRWKAGVNEAVETPESIPAAGEKAADPQDTVQAVQRLDDTGGESEGGGEVLRIRAGVYKKKRVNKEDGASLNGGMPDSDSGGKTFFSYEDAALQPERTVSSGEGGYPDKVIHLQALHRKRMLLPSMLPETADGEIIIDAANPKTPLEKMVYNRFVAGYEWKNKRRGHLYTIPLMAFGSRIAGRRLSSLFTSHKTRSLVPDIYLFRDSTNPGGIVVYYGEFATRRMAEDAARMLSPLFDDADFDVVRIRRAMQRAKQ